MTRTWLALAAIALALALAGCAVDPPAQRPVAAPSPTSEVSPEPAPSTTASPTPPTTSAVTSPPKPRTAPKTTAKRRDPATSPGCGQRAVTAGKFNSRCKEYQGYLDPGGPGRPKTSGDLQREWACQQGYLSGPDC